jgi:RNA polymerase sigma factor (sigma-70 family)
MEQTHAVDATLVGAALRGDRDAFGALVVRYFNAAYAVALAQLGRHEAAQDAVQDAFLNAYCRLNTLRDPARFREWLITIVRNACHSLRRKERPVHSLPLEQIGEPTTMPDVERHDLHALIRGRVYQLDEKAREALLLYYFSGQSQAEIAAVLGISEDAAQKRISRARDVLGQRLVTDVEQALGLSHEERKRREQQALAVVFAARAPWEAGAATGTAVAAWWVKGIVAALLVALAGAGVWVASQPKQVVDPQSHVADVPPEASAPHPAIEDVEYPQVPPGNPAPPNSANPVRMRWSAESSTSSGVISIGGQVLDSRGRPAPDTRVRLAVVGYRGTDPAQQLLARIDTRTDREGRFVVAGLPYEADHHRACDYVVHAAADQSAAATTLYGDNVFEACTLQLAPAAYVEGVVVNEAGTPVAGAEVFPAGAPPSRFTLPREQLGYAVMTDTAGQFRLGPLSEPEIAVAVMREGLATAVVEHVTPGAEVLRIVMRGPGSSGAIEGVVRAEGVTEPLAGVWVALDQRPVRHIRKSWTQTNDQGRFSFGPLAEGTYLVEVDDPAWAVSGPPDERELQDLESPVNLELFAVPAAQVTGHITRTETGEGVGGVFVFAAPGSRSFRWFASDQVVRRAATDHDGRYVIDGLRPGEWRVQCGTLPAGLHPIGDTSPSFTLAAGGIETAEFQGTGSIPVSGIVTDEKGQPLDGAQITFSGGPIRGINTTVSREGGHFRIAGVTAATDRLALYARKDGWAMTPMNPVHVPGTGREDIRVVMVPESRVTGTIRDRDDKPVKGAGVMPIGPHGFHAHGHVDNSDAEGRFSLAGLYPGEYYFAVTPPDSMRYGGADRQGPFTVPPRATLENVDLLYDTSLLSITGTVRDTNGEWVDAEIWVLGEGRGPTGTYPRIGHFKLEELKPGLYSINAWRLGRSVTVHDVPAGATDVALVLPAAVTIAATVVDARTGTPIEAFTVNCSVNDPETGLSLTGRYPAEVRSAAGEFSFDEVAPGDIFVSAIAPGYAATYAIWHDVPPGQAIDDIRIELARAVPLKGRVIDAEGHAVAGARVTAHGADENPVPSVASETNVDGRYEMTSLSPYHVRLNVRHPDYAPAVAALPHGAGRANFMNLRVTRGGTVEAVVTVNEELVTKGYGFVRAPDSDVQIQGTLDGSGTVRIEHVPPGTVLVTVVVFGRNTGLPALHLSGEAEVGEGSATTVELAGETGTAGVRVHVTGFHENAQVRITQSNGHGLPQTTVIPAPKGIAEAANLLAGPAAIIVSGPDGETVFAERNVVLEEGTQLEAALP